MPEPWSATLLLVGSLLGICALARAARSTWESLCPWQGVSRKEWRNVSERALKVWEKQPAVALAAVRPPNTRTPLPGGRASKQSSPGHECWLLSLEGNDPNKEMCLFSVPNRAKSKWTGSRTLQHIPVSTACIPQVRRDSGDRLSVPLLNSGRLVQSQLSKQKGVSLFIHVKLWSIWHQDQMGDASQTEDYPKRSFSWYQECWSYCTASVQQHERQKHWGLHCIQSKGSERKCSPVPAALSAFLRHLGKMDEAKRLYMCCCLFASDKQNIWCGLLVMTVAGEEVIGWQTCSHRSSEILALHAVPNKKEQCLSSYYM